MTQAAAQKTHGTVTISGTAAPVKSSPTLTVPFKTMYLVQFAAGVSYQEIDLESHEGMPGRPHHTGSPIPSRPATTQAAGSQTWYWDIEALPLIAAGAVTVIQKVSYL